jgi:hypothetical protein
MNNTYPIAAVGELIGENARAAILIALLDEKALPAGELARLAGVSAQSAMLWRPWERSQPYRRCGTSSAIHESKLCVQRDRVTTTWQGGLQWR